MPIVPMSGYALMAKWPDDPWEVLTFSFDQEELTKRKEDRERSQLFQTHPHVTYAIAYVSWNGSVPDA